MNILFWIVLGAAAGWLASLIMGRSGQNWAINLALGVLGAALGGFVAAALGLGGISGFNLYSLLIAIAGACLLLAVYGLIRKNG